MKNKDAFLGTRMNLCISDWLRERENVKLEQLVEFIILSISQE